MSRPGRSGSVRTARSPPLTDYRIAGQIYRTNHKPVYRLGHAASLGFWCVALIFATLEWYIWRRRNAQRDAMTEDEKAALDERGVTGDHHYKFRYVL